MTDASPYRTRMETKLRTALDPVSLAILDDSLKHARHGPRMAALTDRGQKQGHAPLEGQGETHFRVDVVSTVFEGLSRIERHRIVNDLLADELRERVHALTIKARTPAEAGATDE